MVGTGKQGRCWILLILLTTGCARHPAPVPETSPNSGHLIGQLPQATTEQAVIPTPILAAPYLPPPSPKPPEKAYTVVAHDIPIGELLLSIARDGSFNIDIIGDIEGRVTLNAIDQTLVQILERLALQAPIRYRLDGENLQVSADLPYLQTYNIDYLNMSRTTSSSIALATQVGSLNINPNNSAGGSSGATNNSQSQVENTSENRFWQSLVDNIYGILGTDVDPGGTDNSANHRVMVNRESGLISVRATHRQHREVQTFIEKIMASARRQVLIEATVVEITLNDSYQAGVDWRALSNDDNGISINQSLTGGTDATASVVAPNVLLSYAEPRSAIGNVLATIQLLDQFGDVKILSSPRIIALNNQVAILKVVDNRVYFTIAVNREAATDNSPRVTTFETQVRTVPVGFVMNLTPFISANNEVILNVRPTISRILGFANDPSPSLAEEGVVNRIPEIQVREIESLLRVNSGNVAVIGGLMQDRVSNATDGVPGLRDIPLLGNAFSYQRQASAKTELLIFLRPTVIDNASLDGDFRAYQRYFQAPENDSYQTPRDPS